MLSAKLYVKKGPYAGHLDWPFQIYCTVKLLNQITDSEHHLGLTESYWDYGRKRVTVASWETNKYYMRRTDQFITYLPLGVVYREMTIEIITKCVN